MKKTILCTLLMWSLALISHAALYYDIDFEPPVYTNGQHLRWVNEEYGWSRSETITTTPDILDNQYLLFQNWGSHTFVAPEITTSGLHYISWDALIPTQEFSVDLLLARVEYGSLDLAAYATSSHPNSTGDHPVLAYDGWQYGPSVPYLFGTRYAYEVWIDLDTQRMTFAFGGVILMDSVPIELTDAHIQVSFEIGDKSYAGIDNFRWEYTASTIPEPATVGLLLLGGGVLALRRKRITR